MSQILSKTLNCPVCDRQEIGELICPNCETDLSPLRILAQLPELSSDQATVVENREPEIMKTENSLRVNNQILLFILVCIISFVLENLVK